MRLGSKNYLVDWNHRTKLLSWSSRVYSDLKFLVTLYHEWIGRVAWVKQPYKLWRNPWHTTSRIIINIIIIGKQPKSDICTYTLNYHKQLQILMVFLLFLPVCEHGQMVPSCNVAFSCKLSSNNRYQWPYISFSYDHWQSTTPTSVQPLKTFTHIESSSPHHLFNGL